MTGTDRPAQPAFELTGSMTHLNHARICAHLRRRNQPWLMRQGLFLAVGVFFLAQALVLVGAVLVDTPPPDWLTYVFFALFFAALLTLFRWRSRHAWRGVRETPARRGATTYSLTPEGLTVTHPLGHTLLRWPAIVDLVDDPQGLMLLTGPMEYIAIPNAAFADTTERAAVLAQAGKWIAQARAAAAP
jgi:hypothetical protein